MRTHLSQVFLRDTNMINKMIRHIAPGEGEIFLEVGPGPGTLTGPLLESGATVVAVELDPALAAGLKENFAVLVGERFFLVQGDYLKMDVQDALGGAGARFVSNLPYHISARALTKLAREAHIYTDAHLTLQKEVADRLVAGPGSKEYGLLTVVVRLSYEVKKLFLVPAEVFSPRPRVSSAFVRLISLAQNPQPELRAAAIKIARAGFRARRKTVANSLSAVMGRGTLALLERAGISSAARADHLSVEDYLALAEAYLAPDPGED